LLKEEVVKVLGLLPKLNEARLN